MASNDSPTAMGEATTLTASDGDGDALTYSVVDGPTNGVLTGVGANLAYTPNAGYGGNAPFSPDANTMGLWHFDAGEGQAASDVSSSGNDGTLGDTGDVDSADPTWVDGYPW